MEKVNRYIRMDNILLASLRMISKREKERGFIKGIINYNAYGRVIKRKVLVNFIFPMELLKRDNMKKTKISA